MKKSAMFMLIPVVGVAVAAFGAIAYYVQQARAYQIAQGLEVKVGADSFWLHVAPQAFFIPGAIFIAVGLFLVATKVLPSMAAPEES